MSHFPVPYCSCGTCDKVGYSILINIEKLDITAECDLYKCQFDDYEKQTYIFDDYVRLYSPYCLVTI